MTMNGEPTPACLAKQLFAQHVRYGDWIRFPRRHPEAPDVDAVVAWDDNGRRSGVFVNTGQPAAPVDRVRLGRRSCRPAARCCGWTRAPATGWSGSRSTGPFASNGYGIAVVTDAANETEVD